MTGIPMKKLLLLLALLLGCFPLIANPPKRKPHTEVSIVGEQFYLNGKPTFPGRTWNGHKVEGLLPNSRMVQGIFDDLNPNTRHQWAYSDTRRWDPDRNTDEFIRAMPEWKKHGLLAFTLNLQGGSPQGYSQAQLWHNSALTATGALRKDYRRRLEKAPRGVGSGSRHEVIDWLIEAEVIVFVKNDRHRPVSIDEAGLLHHCRDPVGFLHPIAVQKQVVGRAHNIGSRQGTAPVAGTHQEPPAVAGL